MTEVSLFTPGAEADQCKFANSTIEAADFYELAIIIKQQPWAPGKYKGNQRLNKTLESMRLLVLDVDEKCTLKDALEYFKDYKHIIATTKSHQKEKNGVVCDRFRVILDMGQPVTSDPEYKSAWFAAKAKWPFIDKQCNDSARFFFPSNDIVSINKLEDGLLFTERVAAPPPAPKRAEVKANGKKGKLSASTKDFLVNGAPGGEWHGRFFKACVDLKEQLYSEDEAITQLEKATNSEHGSGSLDEDDLKQIADVYANRPSKYEPRAELSIVDWPDMGEDKDGNPKKKLSEENLVHLFKKLGYEFSFNKMDCAIYKANGETITDTDIDWLWTRGDKYGLAFKKEKFMALLSTIANRKRFHPIKDVIESKAWDKVDRFEELFATLALPFEEMENTAVYKEYLQKWVVGITAKIYRPGAQNLVLTFPGIQGVGKGFWFQKFALWDKAFGEGQIDPHNKDHELRHLTHLVWHVSELDGTTSKRDVGALKDYLTRDYVSVRPAYGRTVRHGRSICSFCASVNAEAFLMDTTGSRRFLVVPINGLNFQHNVNMQQLFAQAKELLEDGFRYWLDRDEIADLNKRNEAYELQDQVTELAATVQPGDDEMTGLEIMAALGMDSPSHSELSKFGALLKRAKIYRVKRWRGEAQIRLYKVTKPKSGIKIQTPVNKQER